MDYNSFKEIILNNFPELKIYEVDSLSNGVFESAGIYDSIDNVIKISKNIPENMRLYVLFHEFGHFLGTVLNRETMLKSKNLKKVSQKEIFIEELIVDKAAYELSKIYLFNENIENNFLNNLYMHSAGLRYIQGRDLDDLSNIISYVNSLINNSNKIAA